MNDHNINDEIVDQCFEKHLIEIAAFMSWEEVAPRLPEITNEDIKKIKEKTEAAAIWRSRALLKLWHKRKAKRATYRLLITAMLQANIADEATKVCVLLVPTKGSVVE